MTRTTTPVRNMTKTETRNRLRAEDSLRELAYVLALTQKVKNEILAPKKAPVPTRG